MRIVFISSVSLDSPSALGRWFPWACQIASLGHQVHIVALHHQFDAAWASHFRRDDVWIHYVGQMHTRKTGSATHYFSTAKLIQVVITGAIGLAWQASKLRADIYHICKPHPQNSFAGILAARFLNQRCLFLDCDDFEAGINRFSSNWQQQVIARLEEGLPHWVDGVTVHTRFLQARVRKLGISSVRILRVPSGIDRQRFENVSPDSVKCWRARLELDHQCVVAFIGTMALVSHPVDLLLEAFAKLSAKIQEVILLLVGGGPDLEKLQKVARHLEIADRCRFVGRVAPDEIPALLRLADVSVDPVYDDEVAQARWPVKIMENLVMGVPTVTGDVGDRKEMLGDGRAGLLVSPGDPRALADALERVLKDRGLRQRLADGCQAQVTKYDLEDIVPRLLKFYNEKS